MSVSALDLRDIETTGWFCDPQQPELQVPGRLSPVSEGFEIDLDGVLIEREWEQGPQPVIDLVGRTRAGRIVAHRCWPLETSRSFGESPLATQKLSCRGVSEESPNGESFDQVWFELHGFEALLGQVEGALAGIDHALSSSTPSHVLGSIDVRDGRIQLVRSVVGLASERRVDLTQKLDIVVKLNRSVTVEEAAGQVVVPIQSALELLAQEPMPVVWSGRASSGALRGGVREFVFRTGFEREAKQPSRLPGSMLSWGLDLRSLLGFLAAWFDAYEQIAPILGPLFAADRRPGSYVEWRVQAAAVGAEAAYRWLSGSSNKPSFKELVQIVVDASGLLGQDLLVACPSFAEEFKEQRNAAMHNPTEMQTEDAHHLCSQMRSVLAFVLFDRLAGGVDPDPSFIERSSTYSFSRAYLQRRFPITTEAK